MISKTRKRWAILMVVLFSAFHLSAISYKDGKFDILVKIQENEKEDTGLINKIETEMKAASKYLWAATGGQHQFGTVKIIIPKKWSDKEEYESPKNENPDNSDITVGSNITGAYANMGTEKIYVNPGLMDSRGRVIIHEFGHAFYKLGDEYCDYFGPMQIFWTSAGWNKCTEGVDFIVFPPIAIFGFYTVLERNSNGSSASIMWVQWEDSIIDFCNKGNHYKTPNTHQNKINNKQSCQETMEGKFGYMQSGGTSLPYTQPTIEKIKDSDYSKTALVIDRSGSMDGPPLAIAKIAAKIYVQFAEENNYIGVVQFSTNAQVIKNLTQVTDQTKSTIQGAISGISSEGWTSIGDGLLKGMNIVESMPEIKIKKNIIVFSDGEENTAPYIADVINTIVSKEIAVYGIGVGYIGSSNESLRSLCDSSGGIYQSVSDYEGLPKVFNDIHCRINPDEVVLFNKQEQIDPGMTKVFNVGIDTSISNILKFSLNDENADDIQFKLSNPNGVTLDSNYAGYTVGEGFIVFKIGNTDIGNGTWKMTVTNNSADIVNPTLSVIAKSSIKVNASVSEKEVTFPSPIHIAGAAVKDDVAIRDLDVYAEITSPSGIVYTIPLNDKGINGDKMPGDGCYEGEFFEFDGDGNYSITVFFNNISNTAALGVLFTDIISPETQEVYVAPQADKSVLLAENISRQINAPSVTLSGYDWYQPIPPGRIDSLTLTSGDAKKIVLQWAAPGNKGYVGKAASYEMRYSTNELTNENFESGTTVNGLPTPQDVGKYESIIVNTPGNALYYFSVRALNQDGVPGKISNTVTVSTLVTLDASVEVLKSWLVKNRYGKITIKTGNLSQIPVSKFILYRKYAAEDYSAFQEIKQIAPSEISNGMYIYNDKSLEKGKQYTYLVKVVNTAGSEILASNQSEITF